MITVGPPPSPISSLWCDACAEGRHADCVRLWECTCWAYGDEHNVSELSHGSGCIARMYADAGIDLDADLEKDFGDGGLGSGDWMEETS